MEFPRFDGHRLTGIERCSDAEDEEPVPVTEYRDQVAALHRAGRSIKELAAEFEPCAETLYACVKQADRDGGLRADILSSNERDELRRLRRENKQLRQERDILSKAASWFAQNDVTSPRSSNS